MFIWILIAIAAGCTALFLVLLFGRLRVAFDGSYAADRADYRIIASYISASVVSAVRTADGEVVVRIFGRRLRTPGASPTQAPPSPAAATDAKAEDPAPQPHTVSSVSGPSATQDGPPAPHAPPGPAPSADSKSGTGDESGPVPQEAPSGPDTADGRRHGPGLLRRLKRLRDDPGWYWLKQKRLYQEIMRWIGAVVRSLFRVVKFDECTLHVTAHIDDPALNALVFAAVNTLGHALTVDGKSPVCVEYTPLFDDDRLEVCGRLCAHTSAARILRPVAVAVCAFPWYRAVRAWLGYRRTRNKQRAAQTSPAP